jgi:hypothetical protein
MTEQIIRNWVVHDRVERGFSEYLSRRRRGVECPDLLRPEERASISSRYYERLQSARAFVSTVHSA